jgi:hypothetical protein
MAYVYEHIRLDKNIPFYIGIGSDNVYKRANEKTRRNNLWKNIVNKTNYKVNIIYDNITFQEAKIKEIELIKKYGRINLGNGILTNMTDGGDGTLNKIYTDEYRNKLSIAAKKRDNTKNYLKMKEGRKNYVITEEHRRKIINAGKKRKLTDKQIQIIRNKMMENNPSKGRLGKNSINYKFDVLVYKEDVFICRFNGVHEAARNLNLNATKISAVLNGRRNHTGGYKFKKSYER